MFEVPSLSGRLRVHGLGTSATGRRRPVRMRNHLPHRQASDSFLSLFGDLHTFLTTSLSAMRCATNSAQSLPTHPMSTYAVLLGMGVTHKAMSGGLFCRQGTAPPGVRASLRFSGTASHPIACCQTYVVEAILPRTMACSIRVDGPCRELMPSDGSRPQLRPVRDWWNVCSGAPSAPSACRGRCLRLSRRVATLWRTW